MSENFLNIIINDVEIKSLQFDELAGVFLGTEINEDKYPTILSNSQNGNLKILNKINPKSNFMKIQTNFKDIFKSLKINNNKLHFLEKNLPEIYQLLHFYKIIIISFKLNYIDIYLFNNPEILKGLSIYYSSLNIYPKKLIVLSNLQEYFLPISINYNLNLNDKYVAPQIIYVIINGKKLKFDSLDIQGWNMDDLFSLISETYNEMNNSTNKKCIRIITEGNCVYTPVIL